MKHELSGVYHLFATMPILASIIFVAPFLLLLLSIAILPHLAPGFWEKNRNKTIMSIIFGLPVAAFFLIYDWPVMARTMLEYGAFITLLGSLFIILGITVQINSTVIPAKAGIQTRSAYGCPLSRA